MTMLPAGAPRLDEILIQSEQLPWREKSLKGIHEKMLWRNDETGASIALIKFDAGAGIPQPHFHASNQFMFCLRGRYEYTATKVVLTPGCFYCNPKGTFMGPQWRMKRPWSSRYMTVRIIQRNHHGIRMSATRANCACDAERASR